MNKEGFVGDALRMAENINPELYQLVENGLSFVPHLGTMYQRIKFNRLARRFKEHSEKLNRIGQLAASTTLGEVYIRERIFPIALGDLIEEHEDAKINLILNGFENVFIEENSNESVVINHFDTLRNLRYADIKRLLFMAGRIEGYHLPVTPNSEEHALLKSIDVKLENLGLIRIPMTLGFMEGDETETDPDKTRFTLYGQKFLDFITERKLHEV